MRLVSYRGGFGRLVDENLVQPIGGDIVEFIARRSHGSSDRDSVEVGQAPAAVPFSRGDLQPPITGPGKVIAIGLNYRDHAAEAKLPVPPEPIMFAKWANSLVGSGASIRVPPAAQATLDYEAELGVVIGREARRVDANQALDFVAGYMCVNDVSCRGLQLRTSQWTRGKAIDTFLPCGPWLATADEVPDPQALGIRCFVNGELRQDSNTGQMIWGVAELVSFISQTITLRPGDLIATGTPAGVGSVMSPPRFLNENDVVEVEIDGLGTLRNVVEFE